MKGSELSALSIWESQCQRQRLWRTPFLCLFEKRDPRDVWDTPSIHSLSTMWLEDLHAAGVDLLEYGRKEKEMLDDGLFNQDFEYFVLERGRPGKVLYRYDRLVWHLISFTYGHSPSDWHLWFSEPTDEFVGDFWSMIESPLLSVPGAWIEREQTQGDTWRICRENCVKHCPGVCSCSNTSHDLFRAFVQYKASAVIPMSNYATFEEIREHSVSSERYSKKLLDQERATKSATVLINVTVNTANSQLLSEVGFHKKVLNPVLNMPVRN